MSFFSSLFGGSNAAIDNAMANAGQIMNFGTNLGEKNLTTGSNFYNDVLSGDPTKIGAILGPELSGIQQQGQQQIQTAGEFGNRSGGTNAAAQTNIDTQRANVERMISQLTGQAAGAVTGIGENALGTGLNANKTSAEEGQMQLNNIMNSIFGKSFADFAQTGLNAAEGAIGF